MTTPLCSKAAAADLGPGVVRREYYFRVPWIDAYVKHTRDLPMAYMFCNALLFTIPAAGLVFALRSHSVGFLYWLLNTMLFQERFLLGLHFHSHSPAFVSPSLNLLFPLVLSPFFGIPNGIYHLHHVVMHHVENNRAGRDLSSTEPYQRDSVVHFLMYWLRFLFGIWFELPAYAYRSRRYLLSAISSVCVLFFFISARVLYLYNPHGATWVFLLPTFANSFLLMLGNWSQHIFIDPSKPRSNYHLAYNVVNSPCNQRSFNDGYHIEHHLNSRAHWSELPDRFMQNLCSYTEDDTGVIVFDGLDPIGVGILVFTQRFDLLGSHLLFKPPGVSSQSELRTFFRSRLSPVHCS